MQPFMSLTPLVLIGVAVIGVLVALILINRRSRTTSSGARLAEYMNIQTSSEVALEPLGGRRQGHSALERILAYAAVTAPKRFRTSTAADLASARVAMSPDVFLGIRALLLIVVPLLALLWILSQPQKGVMQWAIVGMLVLLAPRLPGSWLKKRIKANERAIQRALPYALDLMVACLEAGLSLEATLDKVAADSKTLLAEEIRRTLAEIALGRPSIEALRELGTRTGVADLKRLTESVAQAERMGISIAEAMRTLADESRTRRRQRAEEEAHKAPIKMLPVLVCCTLPAIGGVVLTPSMIALGRAAALFAPHH